jgi:hypothetical protein
LAAWIFRHEVTATLTVGRGDAVDGDQVAKVHVAAASSSSWLVQLRQENLRLRAGRIYTVSFWARASVPRIIDARLQSPLDPFPTFTAHDYILSTDWQRLAFTYAPRAEVADAFVGFNLAQDVGDVEIDGVTVTDAD